MALLLAWCAWMGQPDLAPAEPAGVNEELAAYLAEAAHNSPELQRLHAEWKATLARVPQATSLDDPQLSYTQFVQSDLQRFSVGLMQMFPWFGTRRTRGEQAEAEAETALSRLYAARIALYQEVKEAYFEYGFLAQSIHTTEDQAQLLRDMEDNVTSRYSLGLSSEADLLRVQMEQSQLEDLYNQLLQQRPVLSTRLASALGRETAEVMPWPQESPLPPPPPPAPVVLAQLRVANPLLAEAQHMIESRQRGVDLAKKKGYPNITLGLEYGDMRQPDDEPPEWPYMFGVEAARGILANDPEMIREAWNSAVNEAIVGEIMPDPDDMDDEIMVGVSVTVPIWRARVRGGIEEAKQMESAAVAEKRQRALGLDIEARQALFEMQDALRRRNLYNDVLIPRARQSYESLEYKYSAGDPGAGFLDILQSVQVLLNYELEAVRASRDLRIGAARLERVLGGPWTAADSEAAPPVAPVLRTPPSPPATPVAPLTPSSALQDADHRGPTVEVEDSPLPSP